MKNIFFYNLLKTNISEVKFSSQGRQAITKVFIKDLKHSITVLCMSTWPHIQYDTALGLANSTLLVTNHSYAHVHSTHGSAYAHMTKTYHSYQGGQSTWLYNYIWQTTALKSLVKNSLNKRSFKCSLKYIYILFYIYT